MYLTVKNICFEKALDLSFPFKQLEITPFFKGYSNENNYRGRNTIQYKEKSALRILSNNKHSTYKS